MVARIERSEIRVSRLPLTEGTLILAQVARPVLRENSIAHITVEGGVRPVGHPVDQSVLDRIEVDVIDVALKVSVVAYCVFPVSALPQRHLAIFMSRNWPP